MSMDSGIGVQRLAFRVYPQGSSLCNAFLGLRFLRGYSTPKQELHRRGLNLKETTFGKSKVSLRDMIVPPNLLGCIFESLGSTIPEVPSTQ